jgi:hypothetical protein
MLLEETQRFTDRPWRSVEGFEILRGIAIDLIGIDFGIVVDFVWWCLIDLLIMVADVNRVGVKLILRILNWILTLGKFG